MTSESVVLALLIVCNRRLEAHTSAVMQRYWCFDWPRRCCQVHQSSHLLPTNQNYRSVFTLKSISFDWSVIVDCCLSSLLPLTSCMSAWLRLQMLFLILSVGLCLVSDIFPAYWSLECFWTFPVACPVSDIQVTKLVGSSWKHCTLIFQFI